MAIAGYSGTPLIKKLGIQPQMKLQLINPPEDYFEWLENDIRQQLCHKEEIPDLVHLFVTNMKFFDSSMQQLKKLIRRNSKIIIWVSWYKKAARMDTDVTEDLIRDYALLNGLVDVKVCAVNDQWSGLKLVVPLSKR